MIRNRDLDRYVNETEGEGQMMGRDGRRLMAGGCAVPRRFCGGFSLAFSGLGNFGSMM